jgi:hypothetical protein
MKTIRTLVSDVIASSMKSLFAALLLLFVVINVSFAHQQKMAITRVELNPRTNMLEVMHRFDLHDAEHAVSELFGKGADIIGSEKTQAQFADYVAERFGIYRPNNESLPVKLVGFETEGKHFWVYQETPKPDIVNGLQIVHNALRDIWFAQTNTVNVKMDDRIETLTFTENTEVLNVEFNR